MTSQMFDTTSKSGKQISLPLKMEFVETELLISLNFDDKIDHSFFKKPNIFFNAVNLDSQKPFIQIDKHVFEGSYADCMGTNIFLEEISEPRVVDKVFQTATPMHLEYLNSSAKILNLKWINVPEEIDTLNDSECVDVRFLEDYQTVLDKIENNTLNIQDAINKMQIVKPSNVDDKEMLTTEGLIEGNNTDKPNEDKRLEMDVEEESIANQDLLKYLIEPVTEDSEIPCNILQDHLFATETCESFSILKQLYLNHLIKEKSILKDIPLNLANIFNLVNVRKSVADGIISKPPTNDDISDMDKQALISIKNFDNLSLPVKFIVLTEYLSEYKKQLQRVSVDELNAVDQFNRTPKRRYKLLKSLARDIEYILLKQFTSVDGK